MPVQVPIDEIYPKVTERTPGRSYVPKLQPVPVFLKTVVALGVFNLLFASYFDFSDTNKTDVAGLSIAFVLMIIISAIIFGAALHSIVSQLKQSSLFATRYILAILFIGLPATFVLNTYVSRLVSAGDTSHLLHISGMGIPVCVIALVFTVLLWLFDKKYVVRSENIPYRTDDQPL